MAVTVEQLYKWPGYSSTRFVDDMTGRKWIANSSHDGTLTRKPNGQLLSRIRTKAFGAEDFRMLSVANSEVIAPVLEKVLKAYLASIPVEG